MTLRRTLLLAALVSLAPTAMVMAQTPPASDTSPSSSSATTPSQHDSSTSSSGREAPTNESTSPSAASSPHQRETTKGAQTASKQSMKDCIAKQQSDNSGMSASDAKKACKAQMRANSG
jgi:hypothetical protein